MKAPDFWYKDKSWQSLCLRPLSYLFAMLTARRLRSKVGYKPKIPTICVGNINVGGSGKTPTTIALVERLKELGIEAHVVSRGYGGNLEGPVQVSEQHHKATDTGDEPLLLAAFAPTWVAKDRAAGVRAAENAGAEVILLDDGFQNPSVIKDLSFVVVNARQGFGNGHVMPAGPLREPIEAGLKRADIVISIGEPKPNSNILHGISVVSASLDPLPTGMPWKNMPVLAFAGIGDPEKFFATVRSLGANIIRSEALEDHQPLTEPLMQRLELEAKARSVQMVTTEKDAVRLPNSFRSKVLTIPVRLKFDDLTEIDAALAKIGIQSKSV